MPYAFSHTTHTKYIEIYKKKHKYLVSDLFMFQYFECEICLSRHWCHTENIINGVREPNLLSGLFQVDVVLMSDSLLFVLFYFEMLLMQQSYYILVLYILICCSLF